MVSPPPTTQAGAARPSSAPRILAADSTGPQDAAFAYAIAGHEVHSNRPLILAEPHRIDRPPLAIPAPLRPERPATGSTRADGWLAEARRSVRCDYRPDGATLQVPGIGAFHIDAASRIIRYTPRRAGPDERHLIEQVLLGPALVTALAYRSIFFLHAGAVRIGDAAAAFCAESGVGKSTLAAFSDRHWEPIADDLLPVEIVAGAPQALPGFPQLKWPQERQYPLTAPPRVPLRSVFVLAPLPAATPGDRIGVDRVAEGKAAIALIRHGVSTRLFAPHLLRIHTQFCAGLAASLSVYRLRYPKRFDILPQLRATIQTLTGA